MLLSQPILQKDLSWFVEKAGELRYPPYKSNLTNLMRKLTVNR